ncbi:MAG: acyl-CoA thioesterase [Pirellulales bacterium]|nr:acyl-CoA thioesterase [Pirellulales bacterium]MDA7991614.1 acyl-CoA thioesterase [Pirellulales bacterium]MDA8043399.1 acyl-CoA thioesterase [Pirellulales bacterium]
MIHARKDSCRSHEIEIRVRYQETDGQRRVHHGNYLTYFEMGRTEMLRAQGYTYKAFEDAGLFMVVAEATCRYLAAAEYDDLLILRTYVGKISAASIRHTYELVRGKRIIATGETLVVCVDSDGKIRKLPDWLLLKS